MKTLLFYTILSITTVCLGQIPPYYNGTNLNQTGTALKNTLATKVTNTQTATLSYTPGIWDATKQTDLLPGSTTRVQLIYGYNDTDGILNTDRTRDVNSNGGATNQWNREHVYPKSLGTPDLGTTGPGADAHHLRAADVTRNGSRGNRKFAAGSGNSNTTAQGDWYPGDEYKGDVARMMLFMYIRYGNRCLPSNAVVGTVNNTDANMINLLLDWNAQDPVSTIEVQRNNIIQNLQGNRNPFIDNPAFATQIWGGAQAQDLFNNTTGGGTFCSTGTTNYPYTQSFENTLGDWSQATSGDDINWTVNSGVTGSSGTGPTSASAGNYYVYIEASAPNNTTKRALLNSPCYRLPASPTTTFKYHMYGASTMGTLSLEVTTNGSTWNTVWTRTGNQGNVWNTATVNLASYANQNVKMRFNGITTTTWQGDIAVDNFSITNGSGTTTSPNATYDVNLRLTFDNYPEETSWEIRNSNNNIVFSGANYGNQPDGSTITITNGLFAGCYTLTIKDTYGDGMCCTVGNGSYRLTDTTGAVLATGGSFATTSTTSFCVGTKTSQIVTVRSLSMYPNPASNILNFSGISNNDTSSYVVYNVLGNLVMKGEITNNSINIERLDTGLHFVTVTSGDHSTTLKFIKE